MFPSVLEVVETRSCEALIHSADALPVGTARKAVASRTTAKLRQFSRFSQLAKLKRRPTENEGNGHGTGSPKLPVNQVDSNTNFEKSTPDLVKLRDALADGFAIGSDQGQSS